jgi:phosphoribosylaminoimidazole-succinocarboxamide synthase
MIDEWQPGRPQRAMDKQFLREWAAAVPGWDKTYPGPEIPADVVATTRARYQEAYERITGNTWTA